MIELLVKTLLAYLLGTVMGGMLLARVTGVDLRAAGSGNVGATNALRLQGTRFALGVLCIDVAKGALAVILIPALPWPWPTDFVPAPMSQAYLCGLAVALGHVYPVWFGFRGGKGVATLAGVFGALLPITLAWMLLAFAVTVILTGFVSLATLMAALVAVLHVTCFDTRGVFSPTGAFTLVMALLVVFTHRANIARLLQRTENRFDKARFWRRWLKS